LFVFPSFYEGFGYPPLEALACGCPVITSNIPVLREILGDEIAVFDPRSVDEISSSIREALSKQNVSTRFESLLYDKLAMLYLNVIQCSGE
jgi:glycosyltransferase involved in cell wall biosynthesis